VEATDTCIEPPLEGRSLLAPGQEENAAPHFAQDNWIDGDVSLVLAKPRDDARIGNLFRRLAQIPFNGTSGTPTGVRRMSVAQSARPRTGAPSRWRSLVQTLEPPPQPPTNLVLVSNLARRASPSRPGAVSRTVHRRSPARNAQSETSWFDCCRKRTRLNSPGEPLVAPDVRVADGERRDDPFVGRRFES
jgi:hypothetical protein